MRLVLAYIPPNWLTLREAVFIPDPDIANYITDTLRILGYYLIITFIANRCFRILWFVYFFVFRCWWNLGKSICVVAAADAEVIHDSRSVRIVVSNGDWRLCLGVSRLWTMQCYLKWTFLLLKPSFSLLSNNGAYTNNRTDTNTQNTPTAPANI